MTRLKPELVALVSATAIIAQQVAANAVRDGLFLSIFPVQSLPYFMAGAAVLAIAATRLSGRLLARRGPIRVAPALFASNAALFLVEWALLDWQPSAAAVLLFFHSTVLGAIAISSFWSLLNERFDAHSVKRLMARVAGAATFGGLVGGVGAERVAALSSHAVLLPLIGLVGVVPVAGAWAVGRGAPARRGHAGDAPDLGGGWTQIRQQPLLRHLAAVIGLAAILVALVDYLLKAQAVAYFGRGPDLVRFFGLFYAGTSLTAVLVQASVGRFVLGRFGLGGSIAIHPATVGAAGVLGFALPIPLGGVFTRGLDVVVRSSTFRAGYEMLYTPLAEATKRSAKSVIDVAIDSAGKGVGAMLILLLVALAPQHPLAAVNAAAVAIAIGEFFIARRLQGHYVGALKGGLRRQGADLEPAVEYSMTDFTLVGTMAGLDRGAVLQALKSHGPSKNPGAPADPVVAAIIELRSGDLERIRAALRDLPRDPLLFSALIPLLARDAVLRQVVSALAGFGARAAGEMVSALHDSATRDVVRRRLPLALKSCPSAIARDGLLAALEIADFEIRLRCGRALLALTDEHPELMAPFPAVLALVERELNSGADSPRVREHVFNLLALALEREPVRIAARAFTTDDEYVRGTALEYLETVLPAHLFSALRPLVAAAESPAVHRRSAGDVRADLIRAGTTMTVSLDDIRRRLEAPAQEET